MLTPAELKFIQEWERSRLAKKKWVRQLSVGLPLGVVLVIAIFANLFSGWYSRAQMVLFRENTSLILVLVIAAIAIVFFIIIFAAQHRWEMNEQHYQELKNKSTL
jgi:membrane protein YdbS with pleckstrin-like domain